MGLLQRKSIGIEISHGGVAGVMLCRQADKIVLTRASRTPFPAATLQHSLKEPQILQPANFLNAVREAWGSLLQSSRSVALSLPDSAGRLMLTSLEDPWKQRDEAAELIRWKLAKRLGMDPDLLHLDFQLLGRRANGASDLLVALIHRNLIQQYEELFLEAGLQPTRIGFNTLHLLRLIDSADTGTQQIVTLYDQTLGTITVTDGKPVFIRSKHLASGSEQPLQLHRELSASLAASRQSCGGNLPPGCRLMASPDETDLTALLTDTFGEAPHTVTNKIAVEPDNGSTYTARQLFQSSAAMGAALGAL